MFRKMSIAEKRRHEFTSVQCVQVALSSGIRKPEHEADYSPCSDKV
jgi:hypothetical protein